MAKLEIIARQSAHPRGLLGHIVARVMALDTASANAWVLNALEPKPGERILELGCGHGRALRHVAQSIGVGEVLGIDPSDVMRDVARRHNRRAIRAGTVRIEAGDADAIPARANAFDKAFTVHTLYFWNDFEAGLRELHRVLRSGGELFLGFHSGDNAAIADTLPRSVYTLQSASQVERALTQVGFSGIETAIEPTSQLHLARARK